MYLFKLLFEWIGFVIKSLHGFFGFFGRLDIDAIGRATFKHCTSPKALYVTLIERWWVIAICASIGIGFGLYSIKTAIPAYESHGSILVFQKLPTFMDNSVRLPDPKAYDSLFSTHEALISSHKVIHKAVVEHDLEAKCPRICKELKKDQTVTDYIKEKLKVGRVTGAFVITVGFGHVDAHECSIVVTAMLETYKEHVNSSMLDGRSSAVKLMSEQQAKLKLEVEQKGKAYRDFLKTAPGVWDRNTMTNSHQKRVATFEAELTALQIRKTAIDSRIEIINQTRDPMTGIEITDLQRLALIDTPHIKRLEMMMSVQAEGVVKDFSEAYPVLQKATNVRYGELMDLYVQRNEDSKFLGSSHPNMIDLDSKIAMMEEKLNAVDTQLARTKTMFELQPHDIVMAYRRLLADESEDIVRRIAFVELSIAEQIAAAKQVTDFSLKARQLEDEFTRTQSAYDDLVARSQKQDLLTKFGSFVAEILAYPHHEGEMTWPKKPVLIALFTILGIFAGSFGALALDLIAFTPLKQAFWFLPEWLLTQGKQLTSSSQAPSVS